MAVKKQQWMSGVRVEQVQPSVFMWDLDGYTWTYAGNSGELFVNRMEHRKRVGTFECVRLAVGFSIGAHEGRGLAERSAYLRSVNVEKGKGQDSPES